MWDQRNSGMRNMVERGTEVPLSLGWAEEGPPAAVVAVWLVSCRNRNDIMRAGEHHVKVDFLIACVQIVRYLECPPTHQV